MTARLRPDLDAGYTSLLSPRGATLINAHASRLSSYGSAIHSGGAPVDALRVTASRASRRERSAT